MTQEPGATFEATFGSGIAGLVGTVEVCINDNAGNTVVAATTAGISEIIVDGSPTGVYSAVLVAPLVVGQYSIIWSESGDFTADTSSVEDLVVAESVLGLSPLPPLTPSEGMGPPCVAWTSIAGVNACCPDFADASSDDQAAWIRSATELLYEASGRRYSGECDSGYVRPCRQGCGCWGSWVNGYDYRWSRVRGRWMCETKVCGCAPVSDVVIAGVPIREITEVLIDGVPLDPAEYALMEPNRLVRMRDITEPDTRLVWPGCQIMDLPETEIGTFAISYTYGADPPQAGRSAAAALACELYRACGTSDTECALPDNVTRVVREGLTIESSALVAEMIRTGQTGIATIDAFIGLFGNESQGRSSVWTPDLDYPRRYRAASGS